MFRHTFGGKWFDNNALVLLNINWNQNVGITPEIQGHFAPVSQNIPLIQQ